MRMTSRERVHAALSHQRPDRTPRDFWAEPPSWKRLMEHVGHNDRDRLLASLGVDIRHLDSITPPDRQLGGGVLQNLWGERFIFKQTPWGPMREDTKGALAEADSFAELESFDWPVPEMLDHSQLSARCKAFPNHALLYGFADIWQRPSLVRGWEGIFFDMVERPEWVHFLCRKFTDFYIEDYTRAAEVTRGRIDLYLVISDLGSQKAPLISLKMFHEFVAPYLKQMTDCIHGLGGKAMYHSCGMIEPFIDELAALGVDLLDPIQPVGPKMQPENLKKKFGSQLSFHGGIDMQSLLPTGSPGQVEAEARRYCQTLGADGGYILAPAHLFQPDVPPENILAMYSGSN